jgi:putative ABC transport system permease protein
MLNDFRFALRTFKHKPGYTVAALLALALGVGANTSIYSIAQGLLFRPLPLVDIDRAVIVEGGRPDRFDEVGVSPADLMDIRERSTSFEYVSASNWWSVNVTGEGFPEQAQGFQVAPNFFDTIAVKPLLGRLFVAQDHSSAGDNRVVVLSEGLWERKFARDPKVLERVIRLNGEPHAIIGVAPRFARVPAEAELWAPVIVNEKFRANKTGWYNVIARLKPGATIKQARAEMRALSQRIAIERPSTNAGRDLRVALLRERISGGSLTADYMRMSLVAASLLLLIAASNVANLLFAMVSGRGREIALRQALGSSRWRIIRQFLVESVVLGLASVPLALLVTLWGLDLDRRAMPAEVAIHLPGWLSIGVDIYALAFGIGAALVTAVIAGLLPAWLGSRADLTAQLREGGRSLTGAGSRSRIRAGLVVVQVTLSMVLIAGAALMYRGSKVLTAAAPARNPEQVLAATVSLPVKTYSTREKQGEFAQKMLERARAMPGVESAALIHDVPYDGGWMTAHAETDATPAALKASRAQLPQVQWQLSSAGYFSMLGVSLVRGRDIADTDGPDSQPVAVISELAARQLFPDSDPIGQRLKLDDGPWVNVVGVCGDVLQAWILRHPLPAVYRPYRQAGGSNINILMRARNRTPEALAPEWRAAMMQLDPELPLFHVDSQARVIHLQMVGLNYMTGMLGVSGLMSMLLAAVGVYSLMSFTATERTREVGIRMALGARPREVIGMLVGQGFRMVGLGLVVGLAGAIALSKVFANLIYGVRAFDPLALGLGAAVLSLAAWIACFIPARWASRVDPMEALRHD